MKPTLTTFFTALLMTFALTACTQDQGETGGMGQTGDQPGRTGQYDTGDTTITGPEQRQQDTGQMSDERAVDLPEESPAAGGRTTPDTTTSPEPGAQSPDTTTSPDTGAQAPGTTTSPDTGTQSPGTTGAPGQEPQSPADEDGFQRPEDRPMNN